MSDSVDWFSVGLQSLPNSNVTDTIMFPVFFKVSGWIAFWSESVATAEAIKAERASMHVLLTPNPPIWTGRYACVH